MSNLYIIKSKSNVLRLFQFADQINCILQEYSENAFLITDNFLRIIFPFEIDTDDTEKSSEKIIKLIENDPNITTKKIAEIIEISSRGVEKQIANLKKEGKLKRIGPDKGGYWKVIIKK